MIAYLRKLIYNFVLINIIMKYKAITAEEAVKIVKSNDKVYIQAAAAVPEVLIRALTARWKPRSPAG